MAMSRGGIGGFPFPVTPRIFTTPNAFGSNYPDFLDSRRAAFNSFGEPLLDSLISSVNTQVDDNRMNNQFDRILNELKHTIEVNNNTGSNNTGLHPISNKRDENASTPLPTTTTSSIILSTPLPGLPNRSAITNGASAEGLKLDLELIDESFHEPSRPSDSKEGGVVMPSSRFFVSPNSHFVKHEKVSKK
jgi:hypothetical protein